MMPSRPSTVLKTADNMSRSGISGGNDNWYYTSNSSVEMELRMRRTEETTRNLEISTRNLEVNLSHMRLEFTHAIGNLTQHISQFMQQQMQSSMINMMQNQFLDQWLQNPIQNFTNPVEQCFQRKCQYPWM